MPAATLQFNEADVVKLVLEFLQNRGLNITMLSLERETGVINSGFSDDLLFLRQLILDGQWDDVLDFVIPLSSMESFNMKQFKFIILKHKYLELLCIKQDPGPMQNNEFTVEEVVQCLHTLESVCPSKEEYSNLCLLLTLPKLSDHIEYQNWNPSNARVECFKDVLPYVEKFLPVDKRDKRKDPQVAVGDRLIQLAIKGILYESCVEYCQHKATSSELASSDMKLSSILSGTGFNDADLSLLSWLQAIPHDTFACPFEQKSLSVDVCPLEKPSLEASWSEQILVTPIKPKMFPYSAVPAGRPRSADIMSRSLNPQYDGLAHGLARGRMDMSSYIATGDPSILSRSFAGFHLNPGKRNPMTTSVDKIFEDGEILNTMSSIVIEEEPEPTDKESESPMGNPSASSTPMKKSGTPPPRSVSPRATKGVKADTVDVNSSTELFKEYQKQRVKIQEEFEKQEQKRLQLQKQLMDLDQTSQGNCINEVDNRLNEVAHNGKNYNSVINNSNSSQSQQDDPTQLPASPSNQRTVSPHQQTSRKGEGRPRFLSVTRFEDVQAIRAVAIHPSGNYYAVGSNSKILRVCAFPDLANLREDHVTTEANIVYKKQKHHKGSIYCLAWNPLGDLIATGSNDKTIKLSRYDQGSNSIVGPEMELSYHDGTVRDLVFMQDTSNKSSLLISGGAGDCKLYVTDCETGTPIRVMSGHSGHIYALHTWGGCMFVSGSQDKTARFWDLRASAAINIVPSNSPGSPFAAVCVDPSGRLLSSGHEDSTVMLWDIRGNRSVQTFKPHTSEVRTVRFSMNAFYLLSGSYDNKIVLTDLHGDLRRPLPSVVVAEHKDKVIQARWHPSQLSFVSTSADRSVICHALPVV